jgi:hypothetical protein
MAVEGQTRAGVGRRKQTTGSVGRAGARQDTCRAGQMHGRELVGQGRRGACAVQSQVRHRASAYAGSGKGREGAGHSMHRAGQVRAGLVQSRIRAGTGQVRGRAGADYCKRRQARNRRRVVHVQGRQSKHRSGLT